MSNIRYTEEFMIEAVRQVINRDYSIAEVAKRLGTTNPQFVCLEEEVRPRFCRASDKDRERSGDPTPC